MGRPGRFGGVDTPAGAGSGTDPNAVHSGDAAGGDFAGTYPNPTIGTDKVVTAKILNANVTLAKIANIADLTILGNISGAPAPPVALTPLQARTVAGVSGKLWASMTAPSAAIANTETVVLSCTIPANYLVAGDTFQLRLSGVGTTSTSPGTGNWRARFAPTTMSGASILAMGPAFTASRTNAGFTVDYEINVYTIGATGTLQAESRCSTNPSVNDLFGTSLVSTSTATKTVDTTVANLLEFTFQSGAASANCTHYTGFIRQL